MDKIREQFENWFSDNGTAPMAVERMPHGPYKLAQAESSWSAWKASRSALVVELPVYVTNVTNKHYEEGRDDVISAVESAGITIKGEEK